jgi:hypothetical protein
MNRLVSICLPVLLVATAFAGTLRTKNGKAIEGEVKLDPAGFAVTLASGQTVKVPLADVERATFEPFTADPALAGATNGFLGTYYPQREFAGQAVRRVDPTLDFTWTNAPPIANFPRENFSVRWTAQLRPAGTDLYTFHVTVDDGVRLWLNERLLIDEWREQSLAAATSPVSLRAGETYNLTVEYYQLTGTARMKLFWSSPTLAKSIVPASVLAPGKVLALPSLATSANTGKGVLTWNGSFIGAPVTKADDTAITFAEPHKGFTLTTVNAARIYFRALSAARAAKLEPKRPGVLLINGDFMDGEFKGISDSRVHLNSVLFGLKSYDINYEALALVLRDPSPSPANFLVKSRAGGALLAHSVAVKDGFLEVTGAPINGLRVAEAELEEFKSGSGTALYDEVNSKVLVRDTANDRQTYTDIANARRTRDEAERMARAIAEFRVNAEDRVRTETDLVARGKTELERKRQLHLVAKEVADNAAAERARLDKALETARAAADKAVGEAAEKMKAASAAKSESERARLESESRQRLAREARAALDRVASVVNTGRNAMDTKQATERNVANNSVETAAAAARKTAAERDTADKALTKATADKDAIEKSAAIAKANADKAVTGTAARVKVLTESKANTDANVAKLTAAAAKAATDKGANSADAQKAAAERDRAATDATTLGRSLSEAKSAATAAAQAKTAADSKAATDLANAKLSHSRAQQEFTTRSRVADDAKAAADRATAARDTLLAKAKAEKESFDTKAAASKADAEKKIADTEAAVKTATAAKEAAERRYLEALGVSEKAARDRSAANKLTQEARMAADIASNSAVSKNRLLAAAEAERAAAEAYVNARTEALKKAQSDLK